MSVKIAGGPSSAPQRVLSTSREKGQRLSTRSGGGPAETTLKAPMPPGGPSSASTARNSSSSGASWGRKQNNCFSKAEEGEGEEGSMERERRGLSRESWPGRARRKEWWARERGGGGERGSRECWSEPEGGG